MPISRHQPRTANPRRSANPAMPPTLASSPAELRRSAHRLPIQQPERSKLLRTISKQSSCPHAYPFAPHKKLPPPLYQPTSSASILATQDDWSVSKTEELQSGGRRRATMKAGDRVKLIGIPPDAKDDAELQTRTLFEKCLGNSFIVGEMESVDGLSQQLARLEVGHVLGEPSYMHTIWVEEQYLEVEGPD